VRAALLWALQLAVHPKRLAGSDRARAEEIVKRLLADAEPSVRRRAAYVAGNLDARALVPDLLALGKSETERPDLRLAALVGLGEIASEERVADLVFLFNREDDAAALSAASRAIANASSGSHDARAAIARVRDRMPKLIAHVDPRVRAAAARIAGLAPDIVPLETLAKLATDASPRVRQASVGALGQLGLDEKHARIVEPTLVAALDDEDVVIQERAADALLALGQASAYRAALEFVADTADEAAAARIASKLKVPSSDSFPFVEALSSVLSRIDHDHPAYETLLELKLRILETRRSMMPRTSSSAPNVDVDIASHFPAWPRLSAVRGFQPLAKSLRTAETLYGAADADGDQSAAIVLWTKSLEGYLHAWLAPRLAGLQRQSSALYEVTDRIGNAWPTYQRWIAPRWADPVNVGGMSIDVPLRSTVNVLRDLGERRNKPVDSPMSVTEWGRLMMFLALDHPSGPKNLLEVTCRDPDHAVRLAHRLQVIALVRNTVTHRSVAATSTLDAFRTLYYGAFEDVTRMA
jgi:HEAT repeat protein